MKLALYAVVAAAIFATCASSADDEAAAEKPDFESLDKAVLVLLCNNMYNRIQQLEKENAALRARLAGQSGSIDAKGDEDLSAVDDGTWVVTIVSNTPTDTESIERQLEAAKRKLNSGVLSIKDQLRQAERRLAGVREQHRKGNTSQSIDAARRAVNDLKRDRTAVMREISQLEDQLRKANNYREINATLDDDRPVVLIARGVFAGVANSLEPSKTYRVSGRGNLADGGGQIFIKSALPNE